VPTLLVQDPDTRNWRGAADAELNALDDHDRHSNTVKPRWPRQMQTPMAAEPAVAVQPAARGAGLVGQHQCWSVWWVCRLGVSVGHHVGVITERTSSTRWLIPGALAFLAVCIAFAAVMLVWHGGIGAGVPAAGGPSAGGGVPAGPGGTPTPSGGSAASSSPGGSAASATRPAGPVTGPIVGVGGLCVDVRSASRVDRTAVQVYGCNGSGAQSWTVQTNGTVQALGKCLDVSDGATADGTPVQLYGCNGTGAQVWRAQPEGTLLNPQSGRCLDDAGSGPAGTQLSISACTGSASQRWRLP
jgi:Ricin-type beta-trefoil lectin domain